MDKFLRTLYITSSIIFIGVILYKCPNIICQTINHKNFVVINKFEESGKIFFNSEVIDSIKYYVSKNEYPIDSINWDTWPLKINTTDTIYPKKTCVLYIKAYSHNIDTPIFHTTIDYAKYIANLIVSYNHKLYEMLHIDRSNPIRGTKLKVNKIRYQASAIFSMPVQEAISKNYDIVLDLYEDSLPLTSSKPPKIKRIEFIDPQNK